MLKNKYPHEIKVIVSDLDHTFSDVYQKSDNSLLISDLNRKMVKWVQDQGIMFTYATGRHLMHFSHLDLPKPSTYVLCNNGGIIYDSVNDTVIKNTYLTDEQSLKLLDFLKLNKMQCYITTENDFYYHNFHGLHKEHDNRWISVGDYIDDPYELLRQEPYQRIEFFNEHENLLKLENSMLAADLIDDTSYPIFTDPCTLGVYPIESQKGAGVEFLSKHHNIPLENFMVFGDAMNDYSMFQKAGVKVAMVQAMPELKNFPGAYIASNCDNDAVGQFLRTWFRQN